MTKKGHLILDYSDKKSDNVYIGNATYEVGETKKDYPSNKIGEKSGNLTPRPNERFGNLIKFKNNLKNHIMLIFNEVKHGKNYI